jgi:C1A family cysteine protease
MKFAIATIVALASADQFADFKAKYNKQYSSVAEEDVRRHIFNDNLEFIESENAKGSNTYTLAVNEFTDLTHSEFKATYLGTKVPENLWGEATHLGTHEHDGSELPTSVDWSQEGAVTPIKNQGQCGSCWSFSTTGGLEGAWEIATGNLVSLSEQQFVDCAGSYGNNGCNGGLMDYAFQYAEANPVYTESSYPYTAADGTCNTSGRTVGIPQGGVVGYTDVQQSQNSLLSAIVQQPVSIAIEADQNAFQFYSSGVLTGTCGTQLDHGVLAVGYGALSGQNYYKVKNSWGASWGMNGYVLIERGSDECGILNSASYPTVNGSGSVVV